MNINPRRTWIWLRITPKLSKADHKQIVIRIENENKIKYTLFERLLPNFLPFYLFVLSSESPLTAKKKQLVDSTQQMYRLQRKSKSWSENSLRTKPQKVIK
jgi:hypothetical protein